MAQNALIQIRIDEELKQAADDLFNNLGLDTPTAIRIFLKQAIKQKGLPFKVSHPEPNSETIEYPNYISPKNIEYTNHFYAYMDILGYKQLVLNGGKEKIHELMEIVHKIIPESFDEYKSNTDIENLKHIKYKIFSDSLCISLKMIDKTKGNLINENNHLLIALIWLIGDIQIKCLRFNIIFRGAISVGRHYEDENLIFSEALVNAYMTESKIAKYPRVIIDNVGKYFLGDIQVLSNLVKHNFLCKQDNKYYVNYLHRLLELKKRAKKFELKERGEHLFKYYMDLHKSLIENNLNSNNEKVVSKYEWLREYHNQFINENKLDEYKIY